MSDLLQWLRNHFCSYGDSPTGDGQFDFPLPGHRIGFLGYVIADPESLCGIEYERGCAHKDERGMFLGVGLCLLSFVWRKRDRADDWAYAKQREGVIWGGNRGNRGGA